MAYNVSDMRVGEIKSTLLNKVKDYVSVMGNFISSNEIEDRKKVVLEEFGKLVDEYDASRVKIEELNKKEISELDDLNRLKELNKKKLDKLSSIMNDEIEFLNFFTADFNSKEPEKKYGLIYEDKNNYFYKGINEAIRTSIIKTVDLSKKSRGEEYNYPEKLRREDEQRDLRIYQVKDRITLDMMNLVGDSVISSYFKGKGEDLNFELVKYFVLDSTNTFDSHSKDYLKYKEENPYDTDDSYIIQKAKKNRDEFDKGINKSIYKNDEDYYSKYVSLLNNFKEIKETVDWSFLEEQEKKKKGLI